MRRVSLPVIVVFVLIALAQWLPWIATEVVDHPAAAAVGAAAFAAVVGVAIARTPADTRPRWGVSPHRGAARLLMAGFAAGGAVYLLVFAARWAFGDVAAAWVSPAALLPILASALVVACYQAASEEIVFRGAVAALLTPAARPRVFIMVSTLVFIVFHAPRGEALVTGPDALHLAVAGIAFAAAYLRTGSLWLGVGLHFGWNLGAYLLREGDPRVVRLEGELPEGWLGWSSWLSVARNLALLLLVLILTRTAAMHACAPTTTAYGGSTSATVDG